MNSQSNDLDSNHSQAWNQAWTVDNSPDYWFVTVHPACIILQCTFLSSFLCPKESACSGSSLGNMWEMPVGQQFFNVSYPKNKMILEKLKTHQIDSLIQNVCVRVPGNRTVNIALLRASFLTHHNIFADHEVLLETRISECLLWPECTPQLVISPSPCMTYVYVYTYIYIYKSLYIMYVYVYIYICAGNHLPK